MDTQAQEISEKIDRDVDMVDLWAGVLTHFGDHIPDYVPETPQETVML